ncbi:uncharacterized protein N7487_010619 [Penicillium crustosum]|uniref:uncharacterized protein n=1 Tax=Penicillium crustosum TaxID=36656 RepID=UPI002386E534|nr:uncharacterized protein N7487_010619 [Penicillium crustosum]KAJ5396316.1 hypothetical protein N7487_010619 [Penicillium crustosum]
MTSFYEYSKTCTIHEFAIQLVLYFTPITSVNMVLPHPNASTTGVDPPLILKHGQWKGIWKSNLDHVMVPSHETEDAYFSDLPRLWACFCRVTMARIGGRRGPDNQTVGRRRINQYDNLSFTEFYAANIGRQPSQYKGKLLGYLVHAHCWVLFGRVEGLKLKEAKLAKLVQVCRKYWRNNKLWQLADYDVRFIEPRQVLSEFEHDFAIYQNPLVVSEVQKAMNCAGIEGLRESRSRHLPSHFRSIPLEVAVLIAEWVCPIKYTLDDIKNTGNMLLVFEWKLPDWFWRGRLDERLFIELDKLKKARSPVSWQLRLNLMCLIVDRARFSSNGLASRERVLGVILDLEEAYLNQARVTQEKLALKGIAN